MNFLKKAVESATSKEEPKEKTSPGSEPPESKPQDHHAHTTSTTELLSSAKVLAGAAQSTLKHEDVDKPKVAGAADDLVHAAAQYGKLEEKGYGQYVDKAETYIHKYGSGTTEGTTESTTEDPTGNKEPSESEKSEGGIGDYAKMAQGFMK